MPKSQKDTKAARLLKAANATRPITAGRIIPEDGPRPPSSPFKVQRAIKFPKPSNALRQHVATVQRKERLPFPLLIRPSAVTEEKAAPIVEAPIALTHEAYYAKDASRPAERQLTTSLVKIDAVTDLGTLLREARRRQGLSQGEVARMAGTGRRFISELEAGKPTVEFALVHSVCAALNIDIFATSKQ